MNKAEDSSSGGREAMKRVVSVMMVLLASEGAAATPEELQNAAISLAAGRLGLPAEALEIVSVSESNSLALDGARVLAFKVARIDGDGAAESVILNEEGALVDDYSEREAESRLRLFGARTGRLNSAFGLAPGASLPVRIEIGMSSPSALRPPLDLDAEAAASWMDSERARVFAELGAATDAAAELARSLVPDATFSRVGSSVLLAKLNLAEVIRIEDALQDLIIVDLDEDRPICLLLDDGVPASGVRRFGLLTRSSLLPVWPFLPTTGAGVSIAFFDSGLPFVGGASGNPYVSGFSTDYVAGRAFSQHSFRVFGLLKYSEPGLEGSAPGASVHVFEAPSENTLFYGSQELERELAAGHRFGLIQASVSPGRLITDEPARFMGPDYFDNLSFRYGILPVWANGNLSTTGVVDAERSHPIADGFNVLSVGGTEVRGYPDNPDDDVVYLVRHTSTPPRCSGITRSRTSLGRYAFTGRGAATGLSDG